MTPNSRELLAAAAGPQAALEYRTLEAACAALCAGHAVFANPLATPHAQDTPPHEHLAPHELPLPADAPLALPVRFVQCVRATATAHGARSRGCGDSLR